LTRGHRAPLGRAGCSGCVLGPRRPRVGSRQERRIPGARPELRPSVSKAFQESGERRKKKKKAVSREWFGQVCSKRTEKARALNGVGVL